MFPGLSCRPDDEVGRAATTGGANPAADMRDDTLDSGSDRPNVLHYWDIVKRSRLLIFGMTTICALLGLGASLAIQPVYRATVILASSQGQSLDMRLMDLSDSIGLLGGNFSPNFSQEGNIEEEALATLTSRGFLTRFIEERKLLQTLFDPEDFEKSDPKDIPTMHDAYEKFIEEILVVEQRPVDKTIEVSIDWKDSTVAADWANSLISRLNSELRMAAARQAAQNIDFLNREAEDTRIMSLKQAIYRMIEAQIHTIMVTEQNWITPSRSSMPRGLPIWTAIFDLVPFLSYWRRRCLVLSSRFH